MEIVPRSDPDAVKLRGNAAWRQVLELLPGLPMSTRHNRFVYVLQSLADPERHYVGLAADVQDRLMSHNSGASIHTAANRPWQVNVVVAFRTEEQAVSFEKYLKSVAGRAFAKKHF